jgi:PTH1 family peptidyl-tRNA hydrolase
VWLVVGLGNPGPSYIATRHNVGFEVVRTLTARSGDLQLRPALGAHVGVGRIGAAPVVVALPMNFMNRSGGPVADLVSAYEVLPKRILVVHDDLDLAFGRVCCKDGGGHGGHNGLRDIARRVGSDFLRVRVGIGRPPDGTSVSDHVLGPWSESEMALLESLLEHATSAVENVIIDGIQSAMNQFNTRQPIAGRALQETKSSTSSEVGEHR